jgi:hypothetical protein
MGNRGGDGGGAEVGTGEGGGRKWEQGGGGGSGNRARGARSEATTYSVGRGGKEAVARRGYQPTTHVVANMWNLWFLWRVWRNFV